MLEQELGKPVTRERLSGPKKQKASMPEGREGEGGLYISTSFSSLPEGLFDELSDIATRNRKIFPRDLFSEAVLYFVSKRNIGEQIPYVVPRKGGEKKTIWLSQEACLSIAEVSKKDKVSKNVLFLTALKMYSEKEGLHVRL
jgi:hypothetical protein